MSVTFEQFFRAIAEQESNSNYHARGVLVRGNRAYGKYQVMDFNIPDWTRQYYGRSLTPEQFLNNPEAQEAVARGKLQSYFNKYGARGAASAWYSGNPNLHMSTGSQSGGPSIKAYVDSVLAKAEKYPAGGGGSSSKTTGGGAVPKLSDQELAEQYGFTLSFLNANREIKSLFQDMVSGGWDKNKFQAKLRGTNWWKEHGETERAYLTLQYTDPAEARRKLWAGQVHALQIASQMGLTGEQLSLANLKDYAYQLVALGRDEAQLRYHIGANLELTSNHHAGQAGELWEEGKKYMYQMGIRWSDEYLGGWVRDIARGIESMENMKNQVQLDAKANFPQWVKQIEAGQSVFDIAQPYMQSMTQILEVPPGSLNLFDPTIKNTLNWVNPGTLKREPKPLWQFENELREDPRWKKTKNAQDSVMGIAHQVLADFGLKY